MRAEMIAKALKGHRTGGAWMACCPAHDDRKPSLSIGETKDGKVLVRCFAGCTQERVISALTARGLWENNSHRDYRFMRSVPHKIADHQTDQGETKRSEMALAIWQATTEADGTFVETYLVSRGLRLPFPPSLRFHPRSKHPTGGIWPAMIAIVTHGVHDTPIGIHRTFLARDGKGKAPVEPAKMMLGRCRGGVVRLGDPAGVLMVGEGIETCLAAMQASGKAAWAALSTSGLRSLDLPSAVRDLIVLADGDDPGDAAAQECTRRWILEGRRVRIARPPRGADFNDLLVGGVK